MLITAYLLCNGPIAPHNKQAQLPVGNRNTYTKVNKFAFTVYIDFTLR